MTFVRCSLDSNEQHLIESHQLMILIMANTWKLFQALGIHERRMHEELQRDLMRVAAKHAGIIVTKLRRLHHGKARRAGGKGRSGGQTDNRHIEMRGDTNEGVPHSTHRTTETWCTWQRGPRPQPPIAGTHGCP